MLSSLFKSELIESLKQFPIKKASLFGSFARGENSDNSDIDILIEPESALTLLDLLKMESKLREKFSRKIDLVEFAAIKPSIKDRILQQAIPLI